MKIPSLIAEITKLYEDLSIAPPRGLSGYSDSYKALRKLVSDLDDLIVEDYKQVVLEYAMDQLGSEEPIDPGPILYMENHSIPIDTSPDNKLTEESSYIPYSNVSFVSHKHIAALEETIEEEVERNDKILKTFINDCKSLKSYTQERDFHPWFAKTRAAIKEVDDLHGILTPEEDFISQFIVVSLNSGKRKQITRTWSEDSQCSPKLKSLLGPYLLHGNTTQGLRAMGNVANRLRL